MVALSIARLKNPQFQQRLSRFGSARALLRTLGFEEREMQDPAAIATAAGIAHARQRGEGKQTIATNQSEKISKPSCNSQ